MNEPEEIRDTLKRAAGLIREDLDQVLHDLRPHYGKEITKWDERRKLDRVERLSSTLALIQTAQNGYLTLGLLWDLKEQVEKNSAQMAAHFDRARH